MESHVTVNFINNTFVDNHSENLYGSPLEIGNDSKAIVYNCLFYRNIPYSIHLINNQSNGADSLFVYYSCIENGINGINDLGQNNYIYYDDSNFDKNPQFFGGDEYPYNLSYGSPCIDAGTSNLPEGIELPEKDLAGSPRIFNNNIDVGAYEWDHSMGFRENKFPKQKKHFVNSNMNLFYSEIYWNGFDDNGNVLPSGLYILSLSLNGKELESDKIIKK